MTYSTKYTIPFVSIKNVPYTVKIQKDGYSGAVTELTGASNPFTVDIDQSDFIYAPMRLSKATLRVIAFDYMDELFSINPHEFRVILESNGVVLWRGFIQPEIFTQDFSTTPVELEIGCVSAMSTLESVEFFKGGDSYTFISLWNLLKRCIAGSNGGYDNLYFPWVYSTSYAAYNVPSGRVNVLESIQVSEQNFFDEDGIPMKMYEVIEEVCKLLGWTCVDYKGDLYLIDPDHSTRETAITSYKGKYGKYFLNYGVYDTELYLPSEINLQTLGFAGIDNSIDKIPGFNKVSVKTSNYPVGEIFPTEDFKTLALYYSQPDAVSSDGKWKAVKRFLKPAAYKLHQYTADSAQTEIDMNTASASQSNLWLGAMAIKRASFEIAKTPTDYSFSEMIQVRINTDSASNGGFYLGASKPILEYSQDLPVAAFANGALGINVSIQLDLNWPSYSLNYFQDKAYPNFAGLTLFGIPMIVMIGDKYLQNNGTWGTLYNTTALYFNTVELLKGGFVANNTTKQLTDPYTGLTGMIIKFPNDTPICGKLKITFLKPVIGAYNELSEHNFPGFFMQGLKVDYKILDSVADKINPLTDTQYSNVVNDAFMNETDGIDLKISSWNNDELCYSKAILGTSFLKNNLYCILTNSLVRPEEMLINRIIEQYSSVKDKTTQVVKNSDSILPFCELSDNYFVNKKFLLIGGSIDFRAESFKITAIEKA